MQAARTDHLRVLAVDPTSRGFGWAVLEGPGFLVDWGVADTGSASSERALGRFGRIFQNYAPDIVILEDTFANESRRSDRVVDLLSAMGNVALVRGATVRFVSRREVHQVFAHSGARTKHEIAAVITEFFPELARTRPPYRKAWMSEDSRSAVFDAIAFAMAYFFLRDGGSSAAVWPQLPPG